MHICVVDCISPQRQLICYSIKKSTYIFVLYVYFFVVWLINVSDFNLLACYNYSYHLNVS